MLTEGLAIVEAQGRLEVRVLADLTLSNAGAIRTSVLSAWEERGRPRNLVMDLAGAKHIDSSGAGALLEIAHRIEGSGIKLALSGLNATVRRMLDRTGLGLLFTILDVPPPALRHFSYC